MNLTKYETVVYNVSSSGNLVEKYNGKVDLEIAYDPQGISCKISHTEKRQNDNKSTYITENNTIADTHRTELFEFPISIETECVPFGEARHLINLGDEQLVVEFKQKDDIKKFRQQLCKLRGTHMESVFSQRTEESSASQYFQFYGYLSQQQNMMQDFVRTSTYQKAIHSNLNDFNGKVVLDVGAGSGILSFFAVQAGAARVFAVEASNMAQYAQQLISANNLSDKIQVIAGKIEEIVLPEKVDIIISEPMGYMLYNERMLETYLHAKKWLKQGGKMFPSRGDLHVAPFTDDALYMEQYNKANFWYQTSFHGVDLSAMRTAAMKEYFRQPIVDTFDIRICMSKSVRHVVDFLSADETDLHRISIPLEFHILETGTCHGLAFWFDVEFGGSQQQIWLSTAPTEPLTHWYQVRCLLQSPIFVKQGQLLTGHVLLVANKRQSYDVTIHLHLEGTQIESSNTLDLKNPYFRYTGAPAAAPPGSSTTSPSENYWNHLEAQGARSAVNLVNGITVNGLTDVSMDISHSIINSNLMAIESFSGSNAVTANVQPNIHPGSIPSTGRTAPTLQQTPQLQYSTNGVIPGLSSPLGTGNLNHMFSNGATGGLSQIIMGGTPTSTQNVAQQQLIGGAISPSLITIQQQATSNVSQVSHLDHQVQVHANSASSHNSGEPVQVVIKQQQTEGLVQPTPTAIIDAPMLSAMQQMFSTLDGGKTVALVLPPNAAPTPIYFN